MANTHLIFFDLYHGGQGHTVLPKYPLQHVFYIFMHLQSLKLLRPTIEEDVNFQERHYLTLQSTRPEMLPNTLYNM